MELACALTDDEVRSRGDLLSETITRMDDLQEERASAMKRYKEQLTGLAETQRKVARAIQTRCEVRMVRCGVLYHSPSEGMKRIVRMDTGEVVREEVMTDAEKQLNLFESMGGYVNGSPYSVGESGPELKAEDDGSVRRKDADDDESEGAAE
jgi:hypothetical protein